MITLNLTNNSGVDIAPFDGTLPRPLGWVALANGANINVEIQSGDLNKDMGDNSGFTFGETLQSLKQRGVIAFTAAALGDTAATGSVPVGIVHNT